MTIKELRIKMRLTQDELATALKVHKTTVSRWERGEINPSFKNIRQIEKLYKVKM